MIEEVVGSGGYGQQQLNLDYSYNSQLTMIHVPLYDLKKKKKKLTQQNKNSSQNHLAYFFLKNTCKIFF